MLDSTGAYICMDWMHYLVHAGRLHRVNIKYTSIGTATGCNLLFEVPVGKKLHWFANYFSSTGGILDASYDPVISALGTIVKPKNCNTNLPNRLLTKFYHTATATANAANGFSSIGIPGGTGVAGHGTSGGSGPVNELILKPGFWLVEIKPFADASTIIINADIYEA